ncbi:MAG: transglutaminase domain-containing protein [Deltaproteobacteria bacterium]|nr:transglutaminase domain-containing protein [Candidatus Zymogenaceae bacterium]
MFKISRITAIPLLVLLLLSCASAVDYETRFEGFEPRQTLMDDWYGVYFTDTKVGWEHIEITKGDLGGSDVIRVWDESVLHMIEDEATPMILGATAEVFLTPDEHLLGFTYDQSLASHTLSIVAEAKEGVVYIDITSGGGTQRIKFDESENIYPWTALNYLFLKEAIIPGKTYVYRVFMEPLRLLEDLTVTVENEEEVDVKGKKEKLYLVRGKIRDYTITSYVRTDGTVIKQVTMDNFVVLRETKEEAMRMGPGSGLSMYAVIDYSLITPNRPIADPPGLSGLTVRITGIPKGTVPMTSDMQAVSGPDEAGGYTYTITRPDPSGLSVPGYGAFPAQVQEYLAPTLEVESSSKEIVDTARKIVGKPTDPLTDAKKISAWVNKNLKKRMVDSTSALDTLRSMEGECQAHAGLAAALFRAAGIPAKVVSGIVYSADIGGFAYHSWNEVYLGSWVGVDASFGQFPADVTHIKFSEGGPESIIDTVPLVGAIGLEVIDQQRQ